MYFPDTVNQEQYTVPMYVLRRLRSTRAYIACLLCFSATRSYQRRGCVDFVSPKGTPHTTLSNNLCIHSLAAQVDNILFLNTWEILCGNPFLSIPLVYRDVWRQAVFLTGYRYGYVTVHTRAYTYVLYVRYVLYVHTICIVCTYSVHSKFPLILAPYPLPKLVSARPAFIGGRCAAPQWTHIAV